MGTREIVPETPFGERWESLDTASESGLALVILEVCWAWVRGASFPSVEG